MGKRKHLTGIVLAGGASSRMGTDKGLLNLNGQPMIQPILNVLEKVCTECMIVTNNMAYQKFGIKLVNDQQQGKGPLMGIVSGLTASQTKHNIIMSCDTPYVSEKLIHFIIQHKEGYDLVLPQNNGQLHPLIGYYSKDILPKLQEKLTLNQLKIQAAVSALNVNKLNCNQFDEKQFKNINAPTDL